MREICLLSGTIDTSISLAGGRYADCTTRFSLAVAPARHEESCLKTYDTFCTWISYAADSEFRIGFLRHRTHLMAGRYR